MCTACRDAFRRFHIFTVPLSPTRASFLLGGRNKHMGYEAYQVRPSHLKHLLVSRLAALCSLHGHVTAKLPCLEQNCFHAKLRPAPPVVVDALLPSCLWLV